MAKALIPHYMELRKILNKGQFSTYKKTYNSINDTSMNVDLISKYIQYFFFKKETIDLIKVSRNSIVFRKNGSIFKVLFKTCADYKTEGYFSHIFYDKPIKSLNVKGLCILILPEYGVSLDDCIETNIDIEVLRNSLIRQILKFHDMNIVHHDIKPSNIVKNGDDWIIIDFGLTFAMEGFSYHYLSMSRGTNRYNVPNFVDEIKFGDRKFWLYMKDWYGFSKTLQKFNYNCDLSVLIDSGNVNLVKKRLRSIIHDFKDFTPCLAYL
tara:strand:- start:1487 stop:2284 length:798 start_codon:yes stop_codon:yes gene_type:complete